MSFLSSLGNIVSSALPVVASLIPGVGPVASAAIQVGSDMLGKAFGAQSASDATNDARGWQQYMANMQNDFNAQQAQLSRDFNSSEAEKSRDFNAQQAQLSRDFQQNERLDAWQKQIEWNSPANQLKLLKEAGMSPLTYGNVASQTMPGAPSAPSASSTPASVGMASSSTIPSTEIVNPSLVSAQVRNLNAQSQKLESESSSISEKLPYEIESLKASIDLSQTNARVNEANRSYLERMTERIGSDISLTEQEISTSLALQHWYEAQTSGEQQRQSHYEEEFQSALRESFSRYNLNLANASEVSSKIAANYAQAASAYASAQLSRDEHLLNGVQLKLVDKYGDKLVSFAWNDEKLRYDASIIDSSNRRDARNKSTSQNWRYQPWSNPRKYLNFALEGVQAVGSAYGTILGGNVGINNSSSQSISRSSSFTNSNSVVKVIK